ncbi:hypothetical protein BDU57DRAFT_517016 [Ampelomyces quisqualis]|uniref:Uncharacterized protein n=1 Tax=Ampelomyces quisqualis TaxID=50730 RepID=A0A6A5QS00_AMPQU|nr:hypothetical protein BDU57DRAFT_517016 [Ampelomyces quisqualis]
MHARQFVVWALVWSSRTDKTGPFFPRHSYTIKRCVSRPESGTCLGFHGLIFLPNRTPPPLCDTLSGTACMALKCDGSPYPVCGCACCTDIW